MIQYSVVIPTNRSAEAIQPLLFSLCQQTLPPDQLVIVYDVKQEKKTGQVINKKYKEIIKKYLSDLDFAGRVDIVDELSTSGFVACQGASYVRNFGRSKVVYPLMMYIDDDNRLDSNACEQLFGYRKGEDSGSSPEGQKGRDSGSSPEGQRREGLDLPVALDSIQGLTKAGDSGSNPEGQHQNMIIVPLQSNHHSKKLIPCLAQSFDYLLCRPRWLSQRVLTSTRSRYCPLLLASSNCLVGPTDLFAQFPFDETIPFVYEDMILTGMMSQAGVTIFADTQVTIHHYHAHRSKLAQMYIDTPQRTYYKAKHRIILVDRLGSLRDRLLCYILGLWGHTVWLIFHILVFAPMRQWGSLIGALLRGTNDGLKTILISQK